MRVQSLSPISGSVVAKPVTIAQIATDVLQKKQMQADKKGLKFSEMSIADKINKGLSTFVVSGLGPAGVVAAAVLLHHDRDISVIGLDKHSEEASRNTQWVGMGVQATLYKINPELGKAFEQKFAGGDSLIPAKEFEDFMRSYLTQKFKDKAHFIYDTSLTRDDLVSDWMKSIDYIINAEGKNSDLVKYSGMMSVALSPESHHIAGSVTYPSLTAEDSSYDGGSKQDVALALQAQDCYRIWCVLQKQQAGLERREDGKVTEEGQEKLKQELLSKLKEIKKWDSLPDNILVKGITDNTELSDFILQLRLLINDKSDNSDEEVLRLLKNKIINLGDVVGSGHYNDGAGMRTAVNGHAIFLKGFIEAVKEGQKDITTALRELRGNILRATKSWVEDGIVYFFPQENVTELKKSFRQILSRLHSGDTEPENFVRDLQEHIDATGRRRKEFNRLLESFESKPISAEDFNDVLAQNEFSLEDAQRYVHLNIFYDKNFTGVKFCYPNLEEDEIRTILYKTLDEIPHDSSIEEFRQNIQKQIQEPKQSEKAARTANDLYATHGYSRNNSAILPQKGSYLTVRSKAHIESAEGSILSQVDMIEKGFEEFSRQLTQRSKEKSSVGVNHLLGVFQTPTPSEIKGTRGGNVHQSTAIDGLPSSSGDSNPLAYLFLPQRNNSAVDEELHHNQSREPEATEPLPVEQEHRPKKNRLKRFVKFISCEQIIL